MREFYKFAAGASLLILVISFIPFLIMAVYDAPVADDFGYGAPVYYALQSGLGIPGVFTAIADNVRYTYQNWQGTFSSVVLFSLQPGVFGDHFYAVTPFVMLTMIIAPIFAALSGLREIKPTARLLIGSVISFIAVQYLPSIADAIFWWNGAAHYMIFFGLLVLTAVGQIRLSRCGEKCTAFYLNLAAGCFLALFVGGGNYSCALVFTMVSFALALCTVIKKQKWHITAANLLMTVFAAAGLLISIAAPGNAVRQTGYQRMEMLPAILLSFRQAFEAIRQFTDLKIIGALMLCVPVFAASTRQSKLQFRYPFVVFFASFCVFAALYTPPIYAMGTSEVSRMENMFWLAYLFLVFGNVFYIAGWIAAKVRTVHTDRIGYVFMAVCVAGGILFCGTVIQQMKLSNAYISYSDLHSDTLKNYRQGRDERKRIYEDKSIQFPRFVPITEHPVSFHPSPYLTWAPDIMMDGTPVNFLCYHTCGGEVTYVGLESALSIVSQKDAASLSDFSNTFRIGKEDCVPLRELCNRLGIEVNYEQTCDTIEIRTKP